MVSLHGTAVTRHGADICYLSSHTGAADVALDRAILAGHGFVPGAAPAN